MIPPVRRGAGLIWILLLSGIWAGPAAAERKVDHSQFPALEKKFTSGPDVTKACLTCHSQIGQDLLTTSHWLWRGVGEPVPQHGTQARSIGKANVINNFCIGVQSNEESCTKCHIGFGWKDKSFNFKDPTKIDCLVCHDTTGDYTRTPSADEPLDWKHLAQSVGPTSIQTCGGCHFRGGGGESVKHGDLDPSLSDSSRELDVHMDLKGLNFTCSTCHRGEEVTHHLVGRSASVSVNEGTELSCQKCHGDAPHGQKFIYRTQKEKKAAEAFHAGSSSHTVLSAGDAARLNWHARTIACQTCHIPLYAKVNPTKTWWDWSKAGRRDEEGRPIQEVDADGNITYMSIKGEFRWGKELTPEYRWYNGTNERYLLGDKLDPKEILVLNRPLGGPGMAGSKIAPFKIMRGKQIYDTVNEYLIQPKLAGDKGSGAYWSDFDWQKSAEVGMAYAGLPYSGQYGFIETQMFWPLAHMTVEGGQALSCVECHTRQGRLKTISGVYIPGQSRVRWLDILGWLGVIAALIGTFIHGALRWRSGRKRR